MNQKDHTSKQYDAELEALRDEVMQMGGLVEYQVTAAVDALIRGDEDSLSVIIEEDHRVNGMEVRIDQLCSHLIARRQPAASDLRMVMAISKIVTDLERIGDEASKIGRLGKTLSHSLKGPRARHLRDISQGALSMLRDVLDAFTRLDTNKAAFIVREDKAIDERFRNILRHLITYMLEDPRTITNAVDLVFIAKALERIGDHAKNIAECIIYIVRGKDVRYISVDQLEMVIKGD